MIYEETLPGEGGDQRAVVECDKPACPEPFYIPGVGAYTGAERMRLVGWEVSKTLGSASITVATGGRVDALVRGYAARCPEHAQGAAVAHDHAWQRERALGYTVCRHCGTRGPE